MNTLSLSTSESSNKVSAMVNAITDACTALVDMFVMTFDKVSAYGIQSIQGVVNGVKHLFVDVIIISLKKIELMIVELKNHGSDAGFSDDYIQSLLLLQKSQIEHRLLSHTFFRENFGRRVNEIFS